MRKLTRQKYNAVMTKLAQLNGVETVSQKFNVEPTIQQKLEEKFSSHLNSFLALIFILFQNSRLLRLV